MSVTFISKPDTPNFCGNELLYEVNGSNHIIAPGTPYSFKLFRIGAPSDGDIITIPVYWGFLVQFTFKTTPSDIELELTAGSTLAALKAELESFLIIQESYVITTVDANNLLFTSIMNGSTNVGTPAQLTGTMLSFPDFSQGTATQAHQSYEIYGSVALPFQVVPISVDVDNNGDGQIDISAITQMQITTASRLSDSTVLLAIGGIQNVTIRLTELMDGNAFKTVTDTLALLPGKSAISAADMLAYEVCTLLPYYYELSELDQFIINKAFPAAAVAIAYFTFYHADGTTSAYTTSYVTLTDAEIVSLRCGPADIPFPENVVYYEMYFHAGSTRTSDTFTFRIIPQSDYRIQFAYINQYGCPEVFHADGVRNSALKTEQLLMRFQREKGRYVTDVETSFTADTGLQPVSMIPLLKDFFSSNNHWVYESGAWRAIVITSSDFDLEQESNSMNTSTFTYIYTNE